MRAIKKLKGLYLRGSVWWLTFRHNGKKQYVSMKTGDYAEAVAVASRILNLPQFTRSDRLSDERERFIESKKANGHFSRHTAEWAGTPLKRLEEFTGNISAAAVTTGHLERFWRELREDLADTSATSYMRAVRSFFSWLQKRGVIHHSPVTTLTLPKVTQAARERFCSDAQRRQLINAAPDWEMKFILYCGFHAGLRRNEISEAREDWLDLANGIVTVQRTDTFQPKDRERRSVPLTKEFLEFLGTYPLPHPFIVRPHKKHGKAIYRYDFRVPFERLMVAQGLPWVTPHTMRHTFASLYISSGGSLYRLANYLGDTPETTEKHYAHLAPDRADIERGHG